MSYPKERLTDVHKRARGFLAINGIYSGLETQGWQSQFPFNNLFDSDMHTWTHHSRGHNHQHPPSLSDKGTSSTMTQDHQAPPLPPLPPPPPQQQKDKNIVIVSLRSIYIYFFSNLSDLYFFDSFIMYH